VKTPVTRSKTERPRAPLLQLGIEFWCDMCRIGGRQGSADASRRGADLEIPPLLHWGSNPIQWILVGDSVWRAV
jgi:hypothetical protein